MRVDVVSGMSAGVLVMFAILVSSASTLGAHGGETVETASEAARALEPIAGKVRIAAVRGRYRRHRPAGDPDPRGVGGLRAVRDVRLA
jgi:hypothetical protein